MDLAQLIMLRSEYTGNAASVQAISPKQKEIIEKLDTLILDQLNRIPTDPKAQ